MRKWGLRCSDDTKADGLCLRYNPEPSPDFTHNYKVRRIFCVKEALVKRTVPHFFLIMELVPKNSSKEVDVLFPFLRVDRLTQMPKFYGSDSFDTARLSNVARVPHSNPELVASLYVDLFLDDVLDIVRACCTVPFKIRTTNCLWLCWTVWYQLLDVNFPNVPAVVTERCAPFYRQSIYRTLKNWNPAARQFWCSMPH